MMGRTHALTGWCAGLAVAEFVGAASIEQAVLFAVTTAGFALLPDLDHPHARASKLLGPISRAVSWLLRHASAALYSVTKGPRDERKRGTHRHLSHTVLFAVGLGMAASAGTEAGGPYAVAAVAVLGLLLAQDALGDWMIVVSAAAVVWWLDQAGPDPLADLGELSGLMGFAVAVGCITHCLGDAITESGCPFLFPIPIAGETWYELRPPKVLRLRTGKRVERLLVFPVFTVLGLLLIPGAWEFGAEFVERMFTPPVEAAQ
ncbi:metal-dependent hydrolase [Actinophytocola glycyrrhizae]|uniref:Metal-dependent hydrolase n=1 Tax=Actinophytocola glycyrrhizae TaxID=2044873 RepID=A0ABV9SC34_9PSEU